MADPTTSPLDPQVINAKLAELEGQRNWALTRCADLAGVNAALYEGMAAYKGLVDMQVGQMADLQAEMVNLRAQLTSVRPLDGEVIPPDDRPLPH